MFGLLYIYEVQDRTLLLLLLLIIIIPCWMNWMEICQARFPTIFNCSDRKEKASGGPY
jgi:hypothetical protein